MRLQLTTALLLLATGCSLGPTTVVRLVDGQEIDGRPVSESAYAAYANGALAEARGDLALAERYYEGALSEDPDSPELWTRLGAVRCARSLPTSKAAFEHAASVDDEYAPLHRERARCALPGDPKRALEEAQRAVALDPADDEAVGLVVDALERSGRKGDALTWAIGRALALPTREGAWQRVKSLAAADPAVGALADRALAQERERRRAVGLATTPTSCTGSEWLTLDRALLSEDLERAQRIAGSCRLPAGQLAVRAAALGAVVAARRQAALVLAADPSNGNALVADMVARDLSGSTEPAPIADFRSVSPPSPLASWLLAEVVARRVGVEAAKSWLAARGDVGEPQEALERSVATRVRAALGLAQ